MEPDYHDHVGKVGNTSENVLLRRSLLIEILYSLLYIIRIKLQYPEPSVQMLLLS